VAQRATIILSEENIGEIVAAVGLDTLMDETIAKLRDALNVFGDGQVEIQPRTGFVYETPEMGLIEFMPAYRRDKNVALKVVGYHPGNPFNRGMPTVMATNSLYDVRDGHLIAVIDGVFATAVRTGAASAVASKLLAHPESKTLGLIGAGAMAVTQAHALSRIYDFDAVLIHDIDPAVEKLSPSGYPPWELHRSSLPKKGYWQSPTSSVLPPPLALMQARFSTLAG